MGGSDSWKVDAWEEPRSKVGIGRPSESRNSKCLASGERHAVIGGDEADARYAWEVWLGNTDQVVLLTGGDAGLYGETDEGEETEEWTRNGEER